MSVIRGRTAHLVLFIAGFVGVAVLILGLVLWHLPPTFILALVVGSAGLVALSIRPYLGVQVFVMLLFLENSIPSGEDVTVMKVLGVLIIGSWLLNMAMRREWPIRFDSLTIAMALFVTWCGASLFYAIDSGMSMMAFFSFAQLALLALMFSTVVDTERRVQGVYWAVVIWAVPSTAVAIAMYYEGMTRVAVGLLGNRNLLAGYINLAIVSAYLLLIQTRHRLARLFLGLSLPLFFLGLALTLSRSALVVLPILLLFVWYRIARHRGFALLLASVLVICVVTLMLPDLFWKRAGSILPAIETQGDTFGMRVRLWKVALRIFEDHPLTGIGAANFTVAYPRYAHGDMRMLKFVTHNAYMGLASEMGIIGLGLYILLLVFSLNAARHAVQAGQKARLPDLEILGVTTEVCLIGFVLGGLTGNCEGLKFLWMLFGLALSLNRLAGRAAVSRVPSQSGPGRASQSVPALPAWSGAPTAP